MIASPFVFVLVLAVVARAVKKPKRCTAPAEIVERPTIVQEALNKGQALYYFGLGSNMLRSKLENRGVNGTRIEILEMEPAVVPNHRLAFNLRGFAPLEPAMGSLEPVENSDSQPLHAYHRPECHGALVKLTSENFEKVMQSEGVGTDSTNPGYEEVVVTAYPYDSNKEPVKAIALRARPHVRLRRDACPSVRYMNILREGATELQLAPCYQEFLEKHPVQHVPAWLKKIAVHNLLFTFSVSFVLKWRGPSRVQNWFLHKAYVPCTGRRVRQTLSNVATAGILLPGACTGVLLRVLMKVTGKDLPPMAKRFLGLIEDKKPEEQSSTDNNKTGKGITLD
jgi:hypothetical protein